MHTWQPENKFPLPGKFKAMQKRCKKSINFEVALLSSGLETN